jgi:hypothetical protein
MIRANDTSFKNTKVDKKSERNNGNQYDFNIPEKEKETKK